MLTCVQGKDDYSVICSIADANGMYKECVFVSWRKDSDDNPRHDDIWYYMNWGNKANVNLRGSVEEVSKGGILKGPVPAIIKWKARGNTKKGGETFCCREGNYDTWEEFFASTKNALGEDF